MALITTGAIIIASTTITMIAISQHALWYALQKGVLHVDVDFVFITNYGTQSNLSGDICNARLNKFNGKKRGYRED